MKENRIFNLSLILQPNKKGVFVIDEQFLATKQVEYLLKEHLIFQTGKPTNLRFGDVGKKGIMLTIMTTELNRINELIDLMVYQAGGAVYDGVDYEDGSPVVPRPELDYAYSHMVLFVNSSDVSKHLNHDMRAYFTSINLIDDMVKHDYKQDRTVDYILKNNQRILNSKE